MSVARVLLIGEDERIMETQAVVLRHFWQMSAAYADWSELALARAVATVDVVVFCATVKHAQRQHWVEAIREGSPEKILVQLNSKDTGPRGGLDATIAVEHGPGAVVATIYNLLVERGISSKGWKPLESTLLDEIEVLGPVQ